MKHSLLLVVTLVGLLGQFAPASGGPIRDWIEERKEHRRTAAPHDDAEEMKMGERDLAYGNDSQQRLDVYIPSQAKAAPIILMVHGGA